jgi:hypothetical protein
MRRLSRVPLPHAAGIIALLSFAPSFGDETGPTPSLVEAHREVPSDPYVPVSRDSQPKSPAMRFASGTFLTVQVNVDALGQNIVGDAANEPTLAVDPTDPDKMVIAWRQFDTITSNFRQAGWGYTTDGGQTWTFPGVIDPGVFRSDPVLDSDSEGRIYYNSLTLDGEDYVCDVFRSDDGGMAWDSGTPAHGGDKQWMAIDKSGGPGDGHVYAFWNQFFSSCQPGFFTRSSDGSSYENCITVPDEPYWGTLAVGPDGKLYAVGASGSSSNFTVARSSNARFALGPAISWDVSTTVALGGSIASSAGPNPGGLLGQASVAVAPTSGPGGDTVYVLCSVNPPGGDPLDVKFARSTDGGSTWSPSGRVNDDPSTSAYQWFGTMSVAPTGRIDVIWLDTRDDPGGFDSSLYYSFSTDTGITWSANERLSGAFDPHVGWPQQQKMGDYFHLISDATGFSLAWAATFNGEQDVYFGRKSMEATAVAETGTPARSALLQSLPNPFERSTTVRYEVPRDAFVTLDVFDTLGRKVATLVSGEHAAGSYETRLDARSLPGGVYFYRLTAGEFRDTQKVLLLK